MATVNKVILVGNLGADPEMKSIPGGQVTNFRLATTESYKDKATGSWKAARVKVVVASVMPPTVEYRELPNASL